MGRTKVNTQLEANLLVECRRRCCICYGLNNDTRVKQGQIAHLDHNPNNNVEGNLAFLCFDHHDLYDTKTSQSKNLTILEVKTYKQELLSYIGLTWKVDKKIDKHINLFSGVYTRSGEHESAELTIQALGDDKVQVRGYALWGKKREYGPNIGELDFVSELNDNKLRFQDEVNSYVIRIDITLYGHKLKVEESLMPERFGYFGNNVTFEGEYYKESMISS